MQSPSHIDVNDDALLADGSPSRSWIGVISVLGYVALCGLVYFAH
jgi:hypothetical protein